MYLVNNTLGNFAFVISYLGGQEGWFARLDYLAEVLVAGMSVDCTSLAEEDILRVMKKARRKGECLGLTISYRTFRFVA